MKNNPSQTVSAGQSALARASWREAKKQFEDALKETDTPEARDGLGLALWWLNQISESHEQRILAYLRYKADRNLAKAAYLAAWLAREQVFLRANVSAMNGWFARAFFHFHTAIGLLEIHEGSILSSRVKLELARTLKNTDRVGAITWARAALAGFERIGAAYDAEKAAQLLREMGTSAKSRPRPITNF